MILACVDGGLVCAPLVAGLVGVVAFWLNELRTGELDRTEEPEQEADAF